MEVAEADPPTGVHAADPKRARLTGEKPGSLMHSPTAASGAVEFFARATVDVSHRDQEIRELKEKVRYLDAQVDSLNQYPGSDQFFQDVVALFPSRPANLPALVKSFYSSEDVVAPLLQALHQDPESLHRALADNVEDWEQVRALLPEQVPPPGLEPFSDPPVGPTDLHTADSRVMSLNFTMHFL
nr:hypothetical protein Iba_chr02bCG11230 [Ipomoea batatas]